MKATKKARAIRRVKKPVARGVLRDILLTVLPPARARHWMSTLQIAEKDARLNRTSLYSSLVSAVEAGLLVRRTGVGGRWEYARAPRG